MKEGRFERRFTQADHDRMWEMYFGLKWGPKHIAQEYGTSDDVIISAIDAEAARRWKRDHPNETNKEYLFSKEDSESQEG